MKKRKFVKVFLSVVLCSVLAISIAAVSKFSKDSMAPKESAATVGSPELVNSNGSRLDKEYCLPGFNFSIRHPHEWIVKDKGKNEAAGSLQSVVINGDSGEILTIKIYAKPLDVENFIKSNVFSGKDKDLSAAKSVISGCEGYSWIKNDIRGRLNGGTVVFFNRNNLFVLNFFGTDKSDTLTINEIIYSIYAGESGPTALAFDITEVKYPDEDISLISSVCCNLTDSYTNGYPCCDPYGNCTWYCEYKVNGNDNFPWYGNACQWIYNSTYPEGATIPEVGAIMVFDSGWYGLGHVAYVTGINTNGSINVSEQGCPDENGNGGYCTRNGSYDTATLRDVLAGYIYRDGSAPNPTAKTISGTIGVQTVVDDFNFSNVYNFQAYGPGIGSNGWGTWNGGINYFYHWTTTTTSLLNYGRWCFYIGTAGTYKIEAYVPTPKATAKLRYHLDGSSTEIGTIDQDLWFDEWKVICTRSLTAGTHNIYVYDNECDGSGAYIAFDALRFTRQ